MAKMGLTVRDDPRKVVDIAGRTWGQPVEGLALSVILKPREDTDELPTIVVAILNQTNEIRRFTIRGWLNFFQVSVNGADGAAAPLTPYGRELFKPERQAAPSEVVLAPGEATEADIPIGSIFHLRKGQYCVQATSEAPAGGQIASNEIQIAIA
jgi:hypothetical protein